MNIKPKCQLIAKTLVMVVFSAVLISCSDSSNSDVQHEAQNLKDSAVVVEQVIIPEIVVEEPTPEKVIEKPKVEVTIKDFKLGMSTQEIKAVIKKVGLKYDDYGVILQNACSSNTDSPKVVPMIEGGMAQVEPHLYDQACELNQYDLLGSTSEVDLILHDNQLVWAHFHTTGTNSAGSNQTLIQALIGKYGEPEKFQYRNMFGLEDGLKWSIDDATIMLKSGSLTLESKSGRKEFEARDIALKQKIGSEL